MSKIQDLEHRVSELEGIGAREALVALMVNMIKMKIDVQQLQPDPSIFDASLPEDEGFEDERRSMNDVTTHMVDADLSSRAPAGKESDTTKTITLAQSEEAKDS
ncbi:hypothetical protein HAX54_035155 [Datura stramonium]|uniref:Uncharacterized protein n=1 Tax=Datura stramonium TaxID=4076 RepID=A0ABS8SF07_DATST|nr:hypothetical protein [Datura stramonium]